MTSFLLKAGFYQCDAELAIFIRSLDNKFLILLLFVDDILLTGTPRRFLGIHIKHRNGKVILHQKAYIQRILERFNAPTNPVATPLDPKHPLVEATNAESLNETDALEYRAAVGALIYLMIYTRPDLAFALSRLSKFVQKPGIKYAAALKRVLRYLAGTQNLGIAYCKSYSNDSVLYGYSDSDFAADLNNRRSTSGFIFLLNGGPISWKSKQQSLITSSTHDAEYIGLATASYEYAEHTMPSNTIHCDNQGAIATANQPSHSLSTRSKHIDIRFHVIREAIANSLIRLEYIRTTEMTADILTKALLKELHERHWEEPSQSDAFGEIPDEWECQRATPVNLPPARINYVLRVM
ncbi:conserved hypothetical protein [Talaromyces stipitatus ATCC 10500]|uniref:Reverse transcriptase Ty1/copia-type domain-containing protein n=1 Tax=Talaromyces stipitatus (strain ATCC 10500 / CBS 375.48 / QM 6759 / NRRL 1006) TaxID=441959 RepID=B8LUX3_TALSN|nr:uncharacterized protein TSTA_060860 [Talaromyces stipitatus ATCC 10500]EED22594.1 conserved hypothetical protein [Talaromyces stipitatus ATCC 10500]